MNRKLSKRLSACLDALSSLSRIADIGTDHAYLPCYGILAGIIDSAIATDIIDGPLIQAKRTIAHYGLTDKIELRKGSGLEPLEIGEAEGVIIAGMGGKLISQLLEESRDIAQSMKLLVFAPQGGEALLRGYIMRHGFIIRDERLLEEGGIIYTIIIVEPTVMSFSGDIDGMICDEIFGSILRRRDVKKELFIKKWNQEIAKIDKILKNIPVGNKRIAELEREKNLIKDVLSGDSNPRYY